MSGKQPLMFEKKTKKNPLILIDTNQTHQFREGKQKKIGMPESIFEDHAIAPGRCRMTNDKSSSPMKEYANAEGFEYSWGHILERRVDKYIVWDFCFSHLLTHYHRNGKRLHDLQRAFFSSLEKTVPITTYDIVPVLSMEEGWKIIPCSTVGAFTMVVHFTQEKAAREWAAYDLLCEAIPKIIKELQDNVKDGTL